MFPNRVPMDRDTLSPELLAKPGDSVHSFIHICWSLQKGALLHTHRKNIRSPSMESHAFGRLTYNGVQPGSQRELLTTMLSLPQCRAAFGTIPSTGAWVDQSPISQRVS